MCVRACNYHSMVHMAVTMVTIPVAAATSSAFVAPDGVGDGGLGPGPGLVGARVGGAVTSAPAVRMYWS